MDIKWFVINCLYFIAPHVRLTLSKTNPKLFVSCYRCLGYMFYCLEVPKNSVSVSNFLFCESLIRIKYADWKISFTSYILTPCKQTNPRIHEMYRFTFLFTTLLCIIHSHWYDYIYCSMSNYDFQDLKVKKKIFQFIKITNYHKYTF